MDQFALRLGLDGRPALWPRTGIGTITRNVLKRMENARRDYEYLAYFDADPGALREEVGAMQCRWGGPRQPMLWSNTWVRRQLHRDQVDVFITFLDKELPLLPTRCKVVAMVHDLTPLRSPDVMFRNVAERGYYIAMMRAAVRRADVVLTNSLFTKSEIVDGLKVPEGKVHPITLGVEQVTPVPPEEAAPVLERYGLKKPYVLAMGSTEPRKNNTRVIEALRMLSLHHPRLRLAIAGAPWRGRLFDRSQIDARVRLLGYVPDEDLRAIMSSAALLAFPSLHEGFGLPVLEAMALGVPVVTSMASGLPEVPGDAAVYADPLNTPDIAAQMHRVLSDAGLAATLSARGRERASLFRWENTCTQIAEVCASLMESPAWARQAATH